MTGSVTWGGDLRLRGSWLAARTQNSAGLRSGHRSFVRIFPPCLRVDRRVVLSPFSPAASPRARVIFAQRQRDIWAARPQSYTGCRWWRTGERLAAILISPDLSGSVTGPGELLAERSLAAFPPPDSPCQRGRSLERSSFGQQRMVGLGAEENKPPGASSARPNYPTRTITGGFHIGPRPRAIRVMNLVR